MQTKSISAELLAQIVSQTFQTRYWSKVSKQPNGCWLWQGTVNNRGYGQIHVCRISGKVQTMSVHRISWIISTRSEVPQGKYILHLCNNKLPRCCNPAHFEVGTQLENVRQMDREGRRVSCNPKGEAHPRAKFTKEQILDIREKYASGNFTYPQLGDIFGVGRTYISKIVRRVLWDSV